MSSVSFNTPDVKHKNVQGVNDFITLINEKMIEAGLIPTDNIPQKTYTDTLGVNQVIMHDPDTFDDRYVPMYMSGFNSTQYICSLAYTLPTGNGGILFEDDNDNPGCKKIALASYDSTDVVIVIHFIFNHGFIGASSTINNKYITSVIQIYSNNTRIATVGSGFSYYPHGSSANYNYEMFFTGQSYISLTQNHLTIAIGCNKLGGLIYSNSGYGTNNFSRYFINFSLYRKNKNVYVFGIPHTFTESNYTASYLHHGNSEIRLYRYINIYNSVDTLMTSSNNLLYRPLKLSAPSEHRDFYITGKTYIADLNGYIQEVPELSNTRILGNSATIYNSIYLLNGHKVMGKYINLGLSERAQCPVEPLSTNYSWSFLCDETTVYTTDAIQE